MNVDTPRLFQAVLFRALCDALGFTGESNIRIHTKLVTEARNWFYDREFEDDMNEVCGCAGFDFERVRRSAQRLIEARQSGDHSNIPEYWRLAFAKGRMPSFSAYAEAIDRQLQRV